MDSCLKKVMDAVDIETFFVCKDEEEGRELALKLLETFGLKDTDIVFIEHSGAGARVRALGYLYRAGDQYAWLEGDK